VFHTWFVKVLKAFNGIIRSRIDEIYYSSGHESFKNEEDVLVTYFGPGLIKK